MTDSRPRRAGEWHRAAVELQRRGQQCRVRRDRLVRALRAEDPKRWTHRELARVVGCSPELIAHILRDPKSSGS